jgi:hypothetical protein
MQIECCECLEHAAVKIDAEGQTMLPKGWTWNVTGCSWTPGVVYLPMHENCAPTEKKS